MRRKFILKEPRFDIPAGTKVYEFTSHDYGLARDDTMFMGREHISVTEASDGATPFFTTPVEILEEV
jgi:hypothetical protein